MSKNFRAKFDALSCRIFAIIAASVIFVPTARAENPPRRLEAEITTFPIQTAASISISDTKPAVPANDGTAVDSDLALNQGMAEFVAGDYQNALTTLTKLPPDHVVAAYYRALCYQQQGNDVAAAHELAIVRSSKNAPSESLLDLGVCQLRTGDSRSAATTLSEFANAEPENAAGRYFLAVALFREGDQDTAEGLFETASADQELAPYAGSYRNLINRSYIDSRIPQPYAPNTDRRWNLTFMTGYEYDSNVSLSPDFTGLGDNVEKDASSWITALFGDYRIVQQENWNVGLVGSLFTSFHHANDNFDLQDYMGGAYTNYGVGDFIMGLRYEFHDTLLSKDQFAQEHRLVPNITLLEGDFGHTTVFYEFDNLSTEEAALIQAMERDGDVHGVGLTQAIYTMEGNGRIFLGYRFEEAITSGTDFDRSTHQVNCRIEHPLTERTVVDAGVRYFWDDYHHPNSLDFFGNARKDDRIEVRTGVQQYVTQHCSIRLDYTYFNSNSNVTNLFDVHLYEYDRHLFSTQFIYDF